MRLSAIYSITEKYFMRETTREWVHVAEEDYSAIVQLFVNGKNPPYGVVCFHCQQCVEKYLKAFLTEQEIDFPRTHWLSILLQLMLPIKPEWNIHEDALNVLSNFATETRYPGEFQINRKVTQNAVVIAEEIREIIRVELDIR